jgi:sterol desaturase/sphingolipid hydroxylase (fatty acid hydroxylase superfamily)
MTGSSTAVGRTETPSDVWPVSRLRVAGASALLVGVGIGLIALAARLESEGAAGFAAFVIGVVLVPLLASPLEWLVHRCVHHVPVVAALRPVLTVHTAHHYPVITPSVCS